MISLKQLYEPHFIYKRSIYAAAFIIVIFIISIVFMLSANDMTFRDLNHDGDIAWTEVFFTWTKPNAEQWWKYLLGVAFSGWALKTVHALYLYDKKIRLKATVA